jgi:hypothetical protein
MTTGDPRRTFRLQVDAWVTRAVKGGVVSLDDLLRSLPGVYPTYAIESVRRLGKANRIEPRLAHRIERLAKLPIATQASPRSSLLPPHPLDFEWRFSRNSGKDLLMRAASYCGVKERIVLLGTPTLAAIASKVAQPNTFIYIGEDNAITEQVRTVNERLKEPLEVRLCGLGALRPNEATVVVLDPPWYFDFLRPMLRAAAYTCCFGGHILISLPPIGANSHVANDRTKLFKLLSQLSLNVLSIVPDAVRYDTPYFEANALAAEGYPNIPDTWRRGDLFVLEKARDAVDFELTVSARRREWHEVVIGRMRLFITSRTPRRDTGLDELQSIVPGDVLATVRRTDPRRKLADVWTSGNRIFRTGHPDLVYLAAIAAGGNDEAFELTAAESDAVARLSYALGELAIKEYSEERRGGFEEASWRSVPFKSRSASLRSTSSRIRFGLSTSLRRWSRRGS